MSIKNKILSRVSAMFLLATIVIVTIVSFNFRDYGIDSSKDKGKIIAELVETGLTSHMINGTMSARDTFIEGISQLKDVKNLWVIRGENVIKQYGPPRALEFPRDEIDKQVLHSGEKVEILTEDKNVALLRITIPYRATSKSAAKCLDCHDAKYGETLGAISMEFDIGSTRNEGIKTIVNIMITVVIAIILVVIITSRIINPYLELFEELKISINNASKGNFTDTIESYLTDEAGKMVESYDNLLAKLDNAFGVIDKKLRTYVATKRSDNPLQDSTEIISAISNIYQFKKAIEQDLFKEDIYKRLAMIIQEKFGIRNFNIVEFNKDGTQAELVLQEGDAFYCNLSIMGDTKLCRAKRTSDVVDSSDFPKICPKFDNDEYSHICIPVTVGGNVGFVINIVVKDIQNMEKIEQYTALIENYAKEAAPVLESKRLMQILRDSSLRDPLTGLHNRRFLDEYVEKLAPQILRQKSLAGILMIDMDYFKKVNDTYGHDVGDIILVELSKILTSNLRDGDLIVRYGGEEFIVILNSIDSEDTLMNIAEKIRIKVEERKFAIGGGENLHKTISIGVSLFPRDSDAIWQSIKFADMALYEAKSTGRNRVIRYTENLLEKSGYTL